MGGRQLIKPKYGGVGLPCCDNRVWFRMTKNTVNHHFAALLYWYYRQSDELKIFAPILDCRLSLYHIFGEGVVSSCSMILLYFIV